jgi:hypothetical protein
MGKEGKGRRDGVTYIDMPYALIDIIRSRSRTNLISITTNDLIPSLRLQVPYSPRQEPGGNNIDNQCRDNEENLQFSRCASPTPVS